MAFIYCKANKTWLATMHEDNLMSSRHSFKVAVKDSDNPAGIYKFIRIVCKYVNKYKNIFR